MKLICALFNTLMRSKVGLDWNEKAFFDEFACSYRITFDW